MKNCENCKHLKLEPLDDSFDHPDHTGFCCDNRQYANAQAEANHLRQLDRAEYRKRGKVCHSPNTPVSIGGYAQQIEEDRRAHDAERMAGIQSLANT